MLSYDSIVEKRLEVAALNLPKSRWGYENEEI